MAEEIGFKVQLHISYEEAVDKVVAALKEEGFGVLTRIDVRETLKEKLGEDFRPYVILGACNPPLAHRALQAEEMVGMMLPCNVTVESDLKGGSLVWIANPEMMMQVGGLKNNEELREVAGLAKERLERVAGVLSDV